MHCTVYRSERRLDTYLYIAHQQRLEDLPLALRAALGTLVRVMELDLQPTRRLAQADVDVVLRNLASPGYYLQTPKDHVSTNDRSA